MRQPTEKEKIYMKQNLCPKCRIVSKSCDVSNDQISFRCDECGFLWSEYTNGTVIVWA